MMQFSRKQLEARAERLALLDWKTWLAILLGACAFRWMVIPIAEKYPFEIGGINQIEVLLAGATGGLLGGLPYYWRYQHYLKRLAIELGVDLDAIDSDPGNLTKIAEIRVRGAWIGALLAGIATSAATISEAVRPANSFGEGILEMNLFKLVDPIILFSCAFAIFHRSRRGALLLVVYSSFVVIAVQIPRVNAFGIIFWLLILVVSILGLKSTIELRKQEREKEE